MRYVIATSFWLILLSELQGQGITRRFFDIEGYEIDSARSYYYDILILNDVKDFQAISYYTKSNSVRFNEGVKDEKGMKRRTYYYPSGAVKSVGDFSSGWPKGLLKSYYSDGSPQSELVFEDHKMWQEKDPVLGIINYWDSLGTQIVINGKGRCACNLSPHSNKIIIEGGDVSEGLKTGEWVGKDESENLNFEELYDKGVVLQGVARSGDKVFEYKDLESDASPNGGIKAFYQHIATTVKYPDKARMNLIEGKVFVEFVVDKEGSLKMIRIAKGVSEELDAEAIKAIKSSPKWNPGMKRGRSVKQRMTLPISFRLH